MDPKRSFSDNDTMKEAAKDAVKAVSSSFAAEEFQAAREAETHYSLGGGDDSHSLHSHREDSGVSYPVPPSLRMSFSVEDNSSRRPVGEEETEPVERRESGYDLDGFINFSGRTNSSAGKSFLGGFLFSEPVPRDEAVSPLPSTVLAKDGEVEMGTTPTTNQQKEQLSYAELRRKRAQTNAYHHRRGPSLSVHLTSPFCGASLAADWNIGFSPSSTVNTLNLADFPNSTSPVRSPRGYGEAILPNAPADNLEMSFRTIAELSISLGTTVREAVYPGIRELFPKLPAQFIISRERVTVPPAADVTGEEKRLLGVGQFGPVLEGQLYPPQGTLTPYAEGGLFTGGKNSREVGGYAADANKAEVSQKMHPTSAILRCTADSSPEIMYQQPINRTNRSFYHSGVSQAFTGASIPLSEDKKSSMGSTYQSTVISMNEWMSRSHRRQWRHWSRRPTNGTHQKFSPIIEVTGRRRRTSLFKQSLNERREEEVNEPQAVIKDGASNSVGMEVQTIAIHSIASTQTPTTDGLLHAGINEQALVLNHHNGREAGNRLFYKTDHSSLGSSPPYRCSPSPILSAPAPPSMPKDHAPCAMPPSSVEREEGVKCGSVEPTTMLDHEPPSAGKRRPSFLLPSPLYEIFWDNTQKPTPLTGAEPHQLPHQTYSSPRAGIMNADPLRQLPPGWFGSRGSGVNGDGPFSGSKSSQVALPFHGLSARTLTDIGSDNDSSTLAPSSQYHPPTNPGSYTGDFHAPLRALDSGSAPRSHRNAGQRYFDSYQSVYSRYPPTPEKKIFVVGEGGPILLDENGSPIQDLDVSSPISMQSQHTHLPFSHKNLSFSSVPTVYSPLYLNMGQPRLSGSQNKTALSSPTQPLQVDPVVPVVQQNTNNGDLDRFIALSEVHLTVPTQPQPQAIPTAEEMFRKALLEASKQSGEEASSETAPSSKKPQSYPVGPVPLHARSVSSSSALMSPSGGCPPYIQHLHSNSQKLTVRPRRLGHSTDYESSCSISGSHTKWANLMLGSSPLPLCSPNVTTSNTISPVQANMCKTFPHSSPTHDSFLDTPERYAVEAVAESSKTMSFTHYTVGSVEVPVASQMWDVSQGSIATGESEAVLSGSKKKPIPVIHTRSNLSCHDLQNNKNTTMLPISSTLNPGMAGKRGGPCRHHRHTHCHQDGLDSSQGKLGSPTSPTSSFSSSSSSRSDEDQDGGTSSPSPLTRKGRHRRETMQTGQLMVLPMTEFRTISPVSWEDGDSWDEHTGVVDDDDDEESCSLFSGAAWPERSSRRTERKRRLESSTYIGNCVPYRSVAVKIFSKIDLDDIQRAQGFVNEVMMGSQLRNPSLVNWLGVAEDLSDFYLIMDVLPSGTLEKLIKDLHADPEERWRRASRLMADIVLALEYLQNGKLHPYDPHWQENGHWGGLRQSSNSPSQASGRSGEHWSRPTSERKRSLDGVGSAGHQTPRAKNSNAAAASSDDVLGEHRILGEASKSGNINNNSAEDPNTAQHHSGIVLHRDIKPSNFMLTSDGHLRLGDFGTACFFGDTEANTYSGTVSYMSNEMIVNNKAGRYSDLWSAGCVLYEILEGTMLFFGVTPYLVHHQIKNFNPESLKFSSLPSRATAPRSDETSQSGVQANNGANCMNGENPIIHHTTNNSDCSSTNSKQSGVIHGSASTATNTLSTTPSNTFTSGNTNITNKACSNASGGGGGAGSAPVRSDRPITEVGECAPKDWTYEEAAMDLVAQLLQPDPTKRLGSDETGGFDALKRHPFFDGIDWSNVYGTNNFLLWEASAKRHSSTPITPLPPDGNAVIDDRPVLPKPQPSTAMRIPSLGLLTSQESTPDTGCVGREAESSRSVWWLPLPDLSSFTAAATGASGSAAAAGSWKSSTTTSAEGGARTRDGVAIPPSASLPPPQRPAVAFGSRLPPLLPPLLHSTSLQQTNEHLILQPDETILFYSLVVVLGDPRFSSCRLLLLLTHLGSLPRLLFVHWQTKELLLAVQLPVMECGACGDLDHLAKLSCSSTSRCPTDQKKRSGGCVQRHHHHHHHRHHSRLSHSHLQEQPYNNTPYYYYGGGHVTTKHSPIIPNAPTGIFCGSPSASPAAHRRQSILANAGHLSLTSIDRSTTTMFPPSVGPTGSILPRYNGMVSVELESREVFCVSIAGKDVFRCRDECGQAELWKQRILEAMKCSCDPDSSSAPSPSPP